MKNLSLFEKLNIFLSNYTCEGKFAAKLYSKISLSTCICIALNLRS
jgi:hypothetical protein